MLKPGPRPRGVCRHCGRRVALRKNGTPREHRGLPRDAFGREAPPDWRERLHLVPSTAPLCPGSGAPPAKIRRGRP